MSPGYPIRLGSIGWSHDAWEGGFYPKGLPSLDRLSFYARSFSTVEVQSTRQGGVPARVFRSWAARVPLGFLFSLRVPDVLAEEILLGRPEALTGFLEGLSDLRSRLGPLHLLVTGPVRPARLPDRLAGFLGILRRLSGGGLRAAIEFRDSRWIDGEVLASMRRHRAALVLPDRPGYPDPDRQFANPSWVTGDFTYIRLCGDPKALRVFEPSGGRLVLDQSWRMSMWADGILERAERGPVFVFAGNGYAGFAPGTLEGIGRMLGPAEPRRRSGGGVGG